MVKCQYNHQHSDHCYAEFLPNGINFRCKGCDKILKFEYLTEPQYNKLHTFVKRVNRYNMQNILIVILAVFIVICLFWDKI